MTWHTDSYMARNGVARGVPGRTHQLNKSVQGDYAYVYGPYAKPVLSIAPGDLVLTETEDAFGGVKTEPIDAGGRRRGLRRSLGRRAGAPAGVDASPNRT